MPRRQGVIGRALRQAGLILVLACGAALACAWPASATPVFLSAINVSEAGQDAFEPQVVVAADGTEHHIWTESDGTNTRIRYRNRTQAGTFSPVETISAGGQDASQPDIDAAPNGDVVAVWTRSDGSNLRVEAASRPANGSWGAVQVVSVAGQNADKPRVSVDDAGKAVAIWIRYDVGMSGTGRIQAAVRNPGGSFGGVQTLSDEGQVTITPQVDSGPAVDANTAAIWARSDGTKLRVQSARRRDVVGFPRPKGASPLRVPLVIGFNACSSPNRTHGPPLASPSCNPPVRSSGPLTVGTPDANTFSAPANSVGSVRYAVLGGDATQPPDEADVEIRVSITDVRNAAGGSDYTGRLLVTAPLTVTDNNNAAETPEPGTTQAFPFQFPVQCTATVLGTIGGQCDVTTTYDALVPGAVIERQRSVWALGQVQVKDAGPNGTGYAACPPTCGDGDETVFMRQGIFVP